MLPLEKQYRGKPLPQIGDNTQVSGKRDFADKTGLSASDLLDVRNDWIYWNHDWYHVKERIALNECFKLYNELLGETISLRFGLPSVQSVLAERKDVGNIVLLTKNFMKKNRKYFTCQEFPKWKYRACGIENLKYLPSMPNKKEFLLELKRFIVRNFYTSRSDLYPENFPFEQREDGSIHFAPLFDYEYSYEFLNLAGPIYLEFHIWDSKALTIIRKDPDFGDLFDFMMGVSLADIFSETEDRYHLLFPEEYRSRCYGVEEKVKKQVREYHLSRTCSF